MKICPFCKNSINENNDICPHCHRVLVERIKIPYKHRSQTPHQETKTYTNKRPKIHLNQLTKNLKWDNVKKFIPILVIVLIVIFISTQKEKKNTYTNTNYYPDPISVIPDKQNNQVEYTDIPEVKNKAPKDYGSLSNGTTLSKNSYYFNGLGELKIKNGTSFDAIVKLINTATNKSVFTFYIKANNVYNINKVEDGYYKLFFNLGNDWDTEIKAFSVNSSYKVFEDLFDFTTREYVESDNIRTQYSTFEVTLNPVIGGQAETENVSAVEFANY